MGRRRFWSRHAPRDCNRSVARNWREVRDECNNLHMVVAAHLPVLPLWQVSETFVYRREVVGIAKKPISLYQDVQKWRLQAR